MYPYLQIEILFSYVLISYSNILYMISTKTSWFGQSISADDVLVLVRMSRIGTEPGAPAQGRIEKGRLTDPICEDRVHE